MPEPMTVVGLLDFLVDQGVIDRHQIDSTGDTHLDDPELEEALAVIGLYPDTPLADIGGLYSA